MADTTTAAAAAAAAVPQHQSAASLGQEASKPVALHNTASVSAFANAMANINLAASDAWPKGKANYSLDKELGTGATSKVYKAFCPLKNNMEIAIKIVNLDSSSVSMDELHRETQGMKKLRHENIVAYYGSFIEDQFLYILMDLCERSLLDMINHIKAVRDISHGAFDENTIATIMREVLKGLHYIHENGLVHRDIKCGNILLKKDGSVQIADFGVTAFINTNPLTGLSVNPVTRHTFVGTPCWMAPEVMEQRQGGYTQKADIWSVGITGLELVTGSAPYAKFTPLKVIILTLNNDPPNLNSVEEKSGQYSAYGHKFRKFISACLIRNDGDRPGARQLLQHPFIKSKAKEKEYIVKALLSGDTPQPLIKNKRRSEDGKLIDEDESDDEGEQHEDWQFPDEEPTAAAVVLETENPDSKLAWYQTASQNHAGCKGVSVKFRLRKRKDEVLPDAGAAAVSASAANAAADKAASPGSAAANAANSDAPAAAAAALSELQDITFDFSVGKDKANGITLELVESGLVSMHDMVVISRALQTLVDKPWDKEKVFPLNSPLPPGVFADQNEFIGYAGLSVVSVSVLGADNQEEALKLTNMETTD